MKVVTQPTIGLRQHLIMMDNISQSTVVNIKENGICVQSVIQMQATMQLSVVFFAMNTVIKPLPMRIIAVLKDIATLAQPVTVVIRREEIKSQKK